MLDYKAISPGRAVHLAGRRSRDALVARPDGPARPLPALRGRAPTCPACSTASARRSGATAPSSASRSFGWRSPPALAQPQGRRRTNASPRRWCCCRWSSTSERACATATCVTPTTSEAEINPVLRHQLRQLYGLELPGDHRPRGDAADGAVRASAGADRRQRTRDHAASASIARRSSWCTSARACVWSSSAAANGSPAEGSAAAETSTTATRATTSSRWACSCSSGSCGRRPRRAATWWTDRSRGRFRSRWPPTVIEQDAYVLQSETESNPYVWDFDLCNVTLGNFNYRKMTLVRDYNAAPRCGRARHPAFDAMFSLPAAHRRGAGVAAPAARATLFDRRGGSDADRRRSRARASARSYIIQGPPGHRESRRPSRT